jgi:hypothetical protein
MTAAFTSVTSHCHKLGAITGSCSTRQTCVVLQAKASDTASSKPYSAAGSAAFKRSKAQAKQHSKSAAATAAEKPHRTRTRNANSNRKAAAPKQRQQQGLSQHLDKLVPAPFQGCRGDLFFDGELRCVQQSSEALAYTISGVL